MGVFLLERASFESFLEKMPIAFFKMSCSNWASLSCFFK